MNATEQRTHRTVTLALDGRLADVEAFVLRLMKNDEVLAKSCDSLETRLPLVSDRVKALAADLEAVQARLAHVDARSEACRRVLTRGFFGRLRWIFHPRGAQTAADIKALQ